MILYLTCYALMIGVGGYLFYFGGKGIYSFLRLKAVGVDPIKILTYGGELVNRYSFACGIEGITKEDLTYRAIISTSHGACIKLTKKRWISSNMYKLIGKIPGSKKVIAVIKWIAPFVGNFLALPFKISTTGYPIEKYLWPQNEITIENIKKSQERRPTIPERLPSYIISSNFQIGDGVTTSWFVADGIVIFKNGLKIEVKPKGNFFIREKGLIYADNILVKGSNSLEHWRHPSADTLPLVLSKKVIPQEKHNKINTLYDRMIQLHELIDDLENITRHGATTDLIVLKGRFAKLFEDTIKLAEDIGVAESIKMIIEKDYESALR